jgi:hypothetical protein
MAEVLMVAGIQLPIIPFVDVVGSVGPGEFWQTGGIGLKSGVTWLVINMLIVVVVPHWPGAGVNV